MRVINFAAKVRQHARSKGALTADVSETAAEAGSLLLMDSLQGISPTPLARQGAPVQRMQPMQRLQPLQCLQRWRGSPSHPADLGK